MSFMIEAVREAPVDPAAVFALYADPGSWNRWGHNAVWARTNEALVEGGTVAVRANYGRVYQCRVVRLDPGRALVLEVRPPLLTIVNTYEVDPVAGGARIRHAFDVSGPLATVTRLIGLGRLYRRLLGREVEGIIRLASEADGATAA